MLLIFYAVFLPFVKQFGNIMDAKGKPHINFWLMMVMAFFNLLANYFHPAFRYVWICNQNVILLCNTIFIYPDSTEPDDRRKHLPFARVYTTLYTDYFRMAIQFIKKYKNRKP